MIRNSPMQLVLLGKWNPVIDELWRWKSLLDPGDLVARGIEWAVERWLGEKEEAERNPDAPDADASEMIALCALGTAVALVTIRFGGRAATTAVLRNYQTRGIPVGAL